MSSFPVVAVSGHYSSRGLGPRVTNDVVGLGIAGEVPARVPLALRPRGGLFFPTLLKNLYAAFRPLNALCCSTNVNPIGAASAQINQVRSDSDQHRYGPRIADTREWFLIRDRGHR